MRFWSWLVVGLFALGLVALGNGVAEAQRQPPYYASIAASKARMRTGPGRNYPASWMYQREDLPIRVIARYRDWRKIEDPDGTQGWMQVGLLSDTRTGMVVGTIAEMRSRPDFDAHVNYRAEPGVVGRISKCARGWCWFDVRGRGGYVEQSKLWGTDPGETVQ
ncbi:SH3 domain-containing protein [Stakelama tenebrarum]|uniref:SH3b domain-containing protein n=1 Tax=Stakelama tenebrarum TaxID=2711215 RepID=A0A6G6Y6E0_9SPHN|nr:SH3 domain-containing protein [Sphingosinithalassobacter tenebrarum]QIG80146.1 hypothetical protein G5C33_10375 [Sphingosinithalassobacter tenebrarum]